MGEVTLRFLQLWLTLRSERPGGAIPERQARGRDCCVPLSPAGSSRRTRTPEAAAAPGPCPPTPLLYLDDAHLAQG